MPGSVRRYTHGQTPLCSVGRLKALFNVEEAVGASSVNCVIVAGSRKIKGEYHGYWDTNNILYVVYDSECGIAVSIVADVYLCRRLGIPYAKQMVLHLQRNLQRGDIRIPRAI